MTIPTYLIEKALALTWKNEWDMCELTIVDKSDDKIITKWKFSIEKFYAYLLSPSFIEKYKALWLSQTPWIEQLNKDMWWEEKELLQNRAEVFGRAIYYHQKWNPEPLLSLLEKI